MNSFGIDDQPGDQTIWLCETDDSAAGRPAERWASASDGGTIGKAEGWGPTAGVTMRRVEGSAGAPAPDTTAETGTRRWVATAGFLADYLGWLPPIPASGYRVVVSSFGSRLERAATEKACLDAGLAGARVLPATDALFCRWLATTPPQPRTTAICVAIGEAAAMLAEYTVETEAGKSPRITRGGPETRHDGGSEAWLSKLVQSITSRFRETATPQLGVAMRRAGLDFAMRLSRAGEHETVPWGGPGAGRLATPYALSPVELAKWPEVRALCDWLENAVGSLVTGLQPASTPAVIVVGGPGAAWPFAQRALATHERWQVCQSPSPRDDLAWGAARSVNVSLPAAVTAPETAPAATGLPGTGTVASRLAAPWQPLPPPGARTT